jgi:hypothetical protein
LLATLAAARERRRERERGRQSKRAQGWRKSGAVLPRTHLLFTDVARFFGLKAQPTVHVTEEKADQRARRLRVKGVSEWHSRTDKRARAESLSLSLLLDMAALGDDRAGRKRFAARTSAT